MPLTPPCPGCGRRRRVPNGSAIVCDCYCPGTAAYKKRMAAITQQPGSKPGLKRAKSQEKRIRAQKGLDPVPEVRYRLIQDESCHWYVIRTDQEEEFNAWQDAMVECEKWDGHDYSADAVGGSPGLVTFPSFEIG